MRPSSVRAVKEVSPCNSRAFCKQSSRYLFPAMMSDTFEIVNPCSDYGFKRATKDSAVVCGFLNTVLELNPPVETVDIITPDLQATFHKGANFTVDLLCRAANGQLILIEMQNAYDDLYAQKAFVEFCRLVSSFDEKLPKILAKRKNRSSGTINEIEIGDIEVSELDNGVKGSNAEFWKRISRVITCVITNKRTDSPGLSNIVNEFELIKKITNRDCHFCRLIAELSLFAWRTSRKKRKTWRRSWTNGFTRSRTRPRQRPNECRRTRLSSRCLRWRDKCLHCLSFTARYALRTSHRTSCSSTRRPWRRTTLRCPPLSWRASLPRSCAPSAR